MLHFDMDENVERPVEERKWRAICSLQVIEVGRADYVEYAGRPLCVVRTGEEEARVVADTCPHAGASLSAGRVYDGCLVCPWHAWEFRLDDGKCPDNEGIGIATYVSRVRGDAVEIAVDPASGEPVEEQ